MNWLHIGLATLAATVPSLGAVGIILSWQKRRVAAAPNGHDTERRRAKHIAERMGVAAIHLLKLSAGLAAIAPAIALGGAVIDPEIDYPTLASLPKWLALYAGGWIAFGWCTRITDALTD